MNLCTVDNPKIAKLTQTRTPLDIVLFRSGKLVDSSVAADWPRCLASVLPNGRPEALLQGNVYAY